MAAQRKSPDWPAGFVAALARKCDPRDPARGRLFRFSGRELTADELLEVARETAWSDLRAREAEVRQAAFREARGAYEQELEIARVARELTGFGTSDQVVEALRALKAGAPPALSAVDRRLLSMARADAQRLGDGLDRLLKRENRGG